MSSPIKRFTASGIETEGGAQHDLDIVFCAIGPSLPVLPLCPYVWLNYVTISGSPVCRIRHVLATPVPHYWAL